jgi:uncharacterized protein YaeQ
MAHIPQVLRRPGAPGTLIARGLLTRTGRQNLAAAVRGALRSVLSGVFNCRQARSVALNATVHSFEVTLNDADRGVYQPLSFRVAHHPSETAEFLLTRVLAYCLEFREGIAFSKGLSDPDAPALEIRDLTGVLQTWIDIGTPDTARLHRAAKAAPRVVVYSHKDVAGLLAGLATDAVHRAREIEIYALERQFLGALAARLVRRMSFDLAVSERALYLTFDDLTLEGSVTAHRLQA